MYDCITHAPTTNQDGKLQLWSVDRLEILDNDEQGSMASPLQQLQLAGRDAVTYIAAMQQEPYVLLGCLSGAVRVAAMVNASGDVVAAARQVRGLRLMPHKSGLMLIVCVGVGVCGKTGLRAVWGEGKFPVTPQCGSVVSMLLAARAWGLSSTLTCVLYLPVQSLPVFHASNSAPKGPACAQLTPSQLPTDSHQYPPRSCMPPAGSPS